MLKNWSSEILDALLINKAICVALFSTKKDLIFSNNAFDSLIKSNACDSFINPSFDKLLTLEKNNNNLIFEGYLTIGEYNSVNYSIDAKIFKKEDSILLIGGSDSVQNLTQNKTLHLLVSEVSNLQRESLNKNSALNNTLAKLNEVNTELIKVNKDKDRLMQIIAHDLRSPFNSILGFSELLIDNGRDYDFSESEKFLQIINTSAKNTLSLLENLLNWGKSQSGEIKFVPTKLLLSNIIKEIIEISNSTAELKNIKLDVDTDANLEIYADKNMLDTVLRNLISNAIKFTNTGGYVKVSAISDHNQIQISVSDNGVGMQREIYSKLFDIESNISTRGTANENGSGLGLILCKELIEKHQGEIWVESEIGKGSTFIFTLPNDIHKTAS
ncbi:sensor histidine kinase [Yeosuana marina]|uniref:sensor histidine kinase n=1 Tax=Yeosuana marina TaxID=1565536 RepID=UPI0014205649|nr:HAMP domain-containing sensor histidine kinase [Yeosuana marina]